MIAKLAIGIVFVIGAYTVGTHEETRQFAKTDKPAVVLEEKMSVDPSPKETPHTEALTTSEPVVTEVAVEEPAPAAPAAAPVVNTSSLDNETIIWNRLISEGYTREQTAGILGNIKQEHNFKTDDVPGGLGIAQWMGGRRAALMARGDYLNINVQLDHLIYELNTTESRAKAVIVSSGLEGATIAFQNLFERCNPTYCMGAQRVAYAYEILSRH